MRELIVRIAPKSIFRPLHSDTLFGAICFAIDQIHGDDVMTKTIEKFKSTPPFLISSTYPYIKSDNITSDNAKSDNGIVYFLPKPITDIEKIDNYNIDSSKILKSVKYVSMDVFNDWINGNIDNTYILKNINKYNVKSGLLFPKEKKLKFSIKNLDVPRNQINRLSNISDIYYFNGYSCKNVGLFFMIRFYDEEYDTLLRGALKFLRDRGFGKDISSGNGKFEIEEFSENKILEPPKNQKCFITLSRYIPSLDEINALKIRKNLFYEIYIKRGRSFNGRLKKQTFFFIEGSTFPNLKDTPYGRILHVQDKSVEYGFAFSVGF